MRARQDEDGSCAFHVHVMPNTHTHVSSTACGVQRNYKKVDTIVFTNVTVADDNKDDGKVDDADVVADAAGVVYEPDVSGKGDFMRGFAASWYRLVISHAATSRAGKKNEGVAGVVRFKTDDSGG
jgi:hypothetical protein